MEILRQRKINSLSELDKFSSEISQIIKKGDIIVLEGNLGSGKTTFVKSICLNYGIENVVSPTFAIVNEYYSKFTIFHFDFYRIKKIEELYDIGIEEYLNNSEAVIFIEWAELFPQILPKEYIKITIQFNDKEERNIEVIKIN
ncbi:MAG: tRNA (adenosine(37)-N6)-threonylcarbamoyltransferase complex ATPase subunit type 1 TsaE [Ignavibacteriae bacterium]|nr:tRNA (adenosine(37)-N6)-threonylcarbamoyltransferase complex ATPase subunit type 1 TsaE [Ignavibacteriota bacterium]